MKNFRLFIVDKNGYRLFASREFKSMSQFAKWFAKNVFMFNTKLNFVLGLTPIEILYAQTSISIWDKETKELIYKGE